MQRSSQWFIFGAGSWKIRDEYMMLEVIPQHFMLVDG